MSDYLEGVDKEVAFIVSESFQIAGGDEFWQFFGFAKTPRYGSFFQKFRPKWRVKLEKTLLQVMTVTVMAAHIVAGLLTEEEIPQLVEVCAGSEDLPVFRSFGYSSRGQFVTHFQQSLADYVQMDMNAWTQKFIKRLGVHDIPDRTLSANLAVGSAKFVQMLKFVSRKLSLER